MLCASRAFLFNSIAIWGAGTMGSGVAQVAAQAGIPVTIVDVSRSCLDVSRHIIEFSLSRIAKKKFSHTDSNTIRSFVDEVVCHITFTTDESIAVAYADLIIEAVTENISAKKELFARIDKMASKETILCTNTSSLSVADIASATTREDRFAGLHFFSPVPMMKLVEVVQTEHVSPHVMEKLLQFVRKLDKTPVLCKDTQGFIVNRLLVPYQMEAARLVERGVASIQDVDIAMRLGCGYPMGPFEMIDVVGIDLCKFIVDGWHAQEPHNELFFPSKLFDDKVAAGKYGVKSGEGFYKYDDKGQRVD